MARVITPEAARAAGISPASLRQVAAWNAERACTLSGDQSTLAASRRYAVQATALNKVVSLLAGADEPARRSRRRVA